MSLGLELRHTGGINTLQGSGRRRFYPRSTAGDVLTFSPSGRMQGIFLIVPIAHGALTNASGPRSKWRPERREDRSFSETSRRQSEKRGAAPRRQGAGVAADSRAPGAGPSRAEGEFASGGTHAERTGPANLAKAYYRGRIELPGSRAAVRTRRPTMADPSAARSSATFSRGIRNFRLLICYSGAPNGR